MPREDHINATVDVFNEEGILIYERLGIILKEKNAEISGIDKKITAGYFFTRKIGDFLVEKYIIKKATYHDHPREVFLGI